jgi:maleylacetate reductase
MTRADDASGLTAPFISRDDLIATELAVGRDTDLVDVNALRKAAAAEVTAKTGQPTPPRQRKTRKNIRHARTREMLSRSRTACGGTKFEGSRAKQQRGISMQPFSYTSDPVRVLFGRGTLARIGEEVARLGKSRALLLSTPQQVADVRKLAATLGPVAVGVFSDATMHTPVEVTERAVALAASLKADCTIALGGGSTTGLGKAIALRTDMPQIVIPTTYAGSEATAIIGETRDGAKQTQRTLKVLPEVIVYDVDLTLSLPPNLTVTSGMNSIAHAIEALYAQDANPVTSLMAEECIRAVARALPRIAANPADAEARSDALYGAWLGGTCLNAVGMALHHKLCHTLGGTFDLPHAGVHTVIIPHATAYNAGAAPAVMAKIAAALGAETAAGGLYDLAASLKAPTSLEALGMKPGDLDRAADIAVKNPYWNPRPIDRAGIRALLEDAFHGRRPA